MAEHDISNFSSSSPHRLPTVSASQALQNLTSSPYKPIATGLRPLDAILQGRSSDGPDESGSSGGLLRGHLTEVYGPPGVGKTTFAYVDCAFPVVGLRLRQMLCTSENPECSQTASNIEELLDHFHHFTIPTLPHLLALLLHPTPNFPPDKTGLIVIDSISTLFAAAFPRAPDTPNGKQATGKTKDTIHWAASRRWSVMGDLVSKLSKLAVTRNIAVLLTNQTTTKVRTDTGAVLRSAIHGASWDSGISTRIVLFRDWALRPANGEGKGIPTMQPTRYTGVLKAGGVVYSEEGGVGKVVPFAITDRGLEELEPIPPSTDIGPLPILPGPSLKRKREEVADSQSEDGELGSDEEFGWADDIDLAPEGLVKQMEDTGTDNTGTDNTGTDNTGTDNTGTDNTGTDNTGTNNTGTNNTGNRQHR